MSKTDTQALGKRRTHSCACSAAVSGAGRLCPVKVAKALHSAARSFAPVGADPDPGMRPLWPTRRGQFPSEESATLTFQKLAVLSGLDARVTGHVCREHKQLVWQASNCGSSRPFCRWGSWAVLEYVRDCQSASVTDMAVRVAKGVQLTEVRDSVYQRLDCRVEPELAVATERAFEEALEESVQSSSIEGLMADQVREQIQGRVMQVAGVGP